MVPEGCRGKLKLISNNMNKKYICFLTFLAMIGVINIAAVPQPDSISVYLIGDSTMSDKEVEAYPETGWGMPFQYYFDESVTVENHARNGRSTRTFLEEGRWQPIVEKLEKGDYVFIQFAHNDEVKTKEQYTNPQDYQVNLTQFVTESRQKGAKPVLLTPTARRHFEDGQLLDTHRQYTALMQEVAETHEVPLIDIDKKSRELLRDLGPENSKFLYNHLEPRENPHYPEGRQDNTHFSEYGARQIAQLVLHGIEDLGLNLASHIYKP